MSGNRLILLTGVTRGLGRALCPELITAGHRVVGCGRDPTACAMLANQYGPPNRFDAVDVADANAVSEWAESVLATDGVPDLLINNAALMIDPAPLWQVEPAAFSALVDVNLKGVFHLIHAFVPAMVRRGAGVIVNLSSGWGRMSAPEVAPYCASKFAIEGLTQALAQELPKTMAAIPLNPGIIDTDMLRQCWGESAGAYPTPVEWAKRAAPLILDLGPSDNGRSLSVS